MNKVYQWLENNAQEFKDTKSEELTLELYHTLRSKFDWPHPDVAYSVAFDWTKLFE